MRAFGASLEPNPRLAFATIMSGIAVGYIASLVRFLQLHQWILRADGKPVVCDFLAFWTAGRLALSAHAPIAYDVGAFHAAQALAAGPSHDFLYWNYPPVFFFVAALLAAPPYATSFVTWTIATGAGFASAVAGVAGKWEAAFAALASPVVLLTAFGGQNGFLTAALVGGFLAFLPTNPMVGGILLGLLTYKPQFGILIPFALIASGHFRALGWATLTAAALAAAAALAFGTSSYISFLHSLPVVSQTYLAQGGEGWPKLHSVYSVARFLGAGSRLAWMAQAAAIFGLAIGIVALWRSRMSFALKASGLVVGAMLCTPYLHIYDFPVLLVAMAFLYRDRPFSRGEWVAIVSANLAMVLCLAQMAPIGPGIIAVVGALVVGRLIAHPRGDEGIATGQRELAAA